MPMPAAQVTSKSPEPDYVRTSGVKIWHDGSLQGFTGYLTAAYQTQPAGRSGYAGYPSPGKAGRNGPGLSPAGYQIAIHANGDAAIDDVLLAYRTVQSEFPRPDARHRIEHCQTPRKDQLDQIKELGITPSFFVGHVYYWGDRHLKIFLGPERAARISPLASAASRRGVRFTIHNDTPVTPIDPLLLVWCSVNRTMKDGTTLGPEQRITRVCGSAVSDARRRLAKPRRADQRLPRGRKAGGLCRSGGESIDGQSRSSQGHSDCGNDRGRRDAIQKLRTRTAHEQLRPFAH